MGNSAPLVVRLDGAEWDIYASQDLEKQLEATLGCANVILDLTPVTYMDSTCLGKLAVMAREHAARGLPAARLVVPSATVRRLFAIVTFDKVWQIYDTLADALADARDAGLVNEASAI